MVEKVAAGCRFYLSNKVFDFAQFRGSLMLEIQTLKECS